jgi:hypothetical protein
MKSCILCSFARNHGRTIQSYLLEQITLFNIYVLRDGYSKKFLINSAHALTHVVRLVTYIYCIHWGVFLAYLASVCSDLLGPVLLYHKQYPTFPVEVIIFDAGHKHPCL